MKFPEWPIKNHIELLKDILEVWKKECEKKPPTMSSEDAYATLGLEAGQAFDLAKVRKAYFKMLVPARGRHLGLGPTAPCPRPGP